MMFQAMARCVLVFLILLQQAASVELQSCSCSDCNCAGDNTGCTCEFGSADGLCIASGDCREWVRVVCHEDHDLSLSARPDGAECDFQKNSLSGTGACMPLDSSYATSTEKRCVAKGFFECKDKKEGESCGSEGGLCGVAASGEALQCLEAAEYICIDKDNGAECKYQLAPGTHGKDLALSGVEASSWCFKKTSGAKSECVESEVGACVGKSEGDKCADYSVYRKEWLGRGANKQDLGHELYRDHFSGGTCKGISADERTCEDAESYSSEIVVASASVISSAKASSLWPSLSCWLLLFFSCIGIVPATLVGG
eukprot:TRINITY_DN23867_c0_g1_i1.p1 TRINITY_DN23867_c0_g1~~TRINITY_DN23867_c0_g1_i1.p1  ORF type:complete len:312 (+),score=31.53 TRINITY_DN23867_c0_g1_i1:108-1043(+)